MARLRLDRTGTSMALSHQIDVARRLIFHRAWDTLTDLEAYAHAHSLRADPGFDPGFRQLIDVREVTSLRLSAAVVQHLARCPDLGPGARCAIVTATLEQFGVARMFGLHAANDGVDVEVFRDWRPAAEWLGLSGGVLEDPRSASGRG